jgi:phosphogluconate dehydratase
MTHAVLEQVAARIITRSQQTRAAYLARMQRLESGDRQRRHLSCSNLAHGVAILDEAAKNKLSQGQGLNVGIVTAYNDMLSAHHPYADYPPMIKHELAQYGISAQVAGGVPAMCDGVTQGQPSMELSLLSRDTIARATAIALTHNMFDGAICLGICDKIVPGLLIGALSFGFLPTIFLPAGPMPSGLPNKDKAAIRQAYAEKRVDEKALLKAEMQCYHTAGTCTFYGTANSNQMLMEFLGLHLPGASFVNPQDPLRQLLNQQSLAIFAQQLPHAKAPLAQVINAYSLVNGIAGLLATGGSTNLTIHLIAIAKAAGLLLTWQDMADLSQVVPLLAHVYPNGAADVNEFHAQGGTSFCVRELLNAGLLFSEPLVNPFDLSMADYAQQPAIQAPMEQATLENSQLIFRDAPAAIDDHPILRAVQKPFSAHGGLCFVDGNLGQAIVKTSAVKADYWQIKAPALVFNDQQSVQSAFAQGQLHQDCVIVVRFQGPRANGMPELHQLMPLMGSLQDKGFRVALLTDGRLSGASGKVLAAIHCTPEAANNGALARVHNGDVIEIDAMAGQLICHVDEKIWQQRIPASAPMEDDQTGHGRELFAILREHISDAASGATTF